MDIDGISIKMLEETVEKDDTVYVWLLDNGTLKKTPLSKILELVHTLYSEREAYRKGLRRLKKRNEKLVHQNAEEIVKKFCETTMYKENQALVTERGSLKKEVEEYEATFDIFNQRKYRKMFVEEWKEEYQKELDKQGEGVIAGFPDADYVYKRYFEQKAEIERLTEENIEERDIHFKNLCGYKDEIARLQKQVDELTAKREVGREKLKDEIATKIFMGCSYGAIVCGKMTIERAKLEAEQYIEFAWDMVQQAEKDTAKEILTELLETKIKIGNEYYVFADNIKVIAKRKGVEVE